MLSDEPITIGKLTVQDRLVMPPMQTNKTDEGHVTDELIAYYRERAVGSKPGIIVIEHSCIARNARAAEEQLSIASDDMIAEHKRLTDAIHEGGCMAFVQLNHAGSNGIDESVSASSVNIPIKKLFKKPRDLSVQEILAIEEAFAAAAVLTFALVATFIPMYPAAVEKAAPTRKHTADIQLMPAPMRTNKMATNTTRILYSAIKKALAPS